MTVRALARPVILAVCGGLSEAQAHAHINPMRRPVP
ncbi:hypothetical protein AcdelDRAFT_0423 [Acidovorax delafieldii 2AN]|uniref:Uncharacterized protein n=1 Tax=Acidovorax delafieldii 2AN TaxID=573060 RepID=C5T0J3_ACIDE|nr:hypothetical protein AcdelDRAFT_0423 [Acidovorax delafieldii 2AN]